MPAACEISLFKHILDNESRLHRHDLIHFFLFPRFLSFPACTCPRSFIGDLCLGTARFHSTLRVGNK